MTASLLLSVLCAFFNDVPTCYARARKNTHKTSREKKIVVCPGNVRVRMNICSLAPEYFRRVSDFYYFYECRWLSFVFFFCSFFYFCVSIRWSIWKYGKRREKNENEENCKLLFVFFVWPRPLKPAKCDCII